MDITEKILTDKRYKNRLDRLDSETLLSIADDHIKALEAAHKGIAQEEPEKLNDVAYLQAVANAMQKLAQRVLEIHDKN